MLADYHMHTSFSDDSVYPMKDCINRAISLGFDEICFTEHIDYGCVNAYCCDCQTYLDTVRKYQKEYSNKITIKYGIEFGAQARHKKYFKEIFDLEKFDIKNEVQIILNKVKSMKNILIKSCGIRIFKPEKLKKNITEFILKKCSKHRKPSIFTVYLPILI